MNADQAEIQAALAGESRFLRRLASTLSEWAEQMQRGDHEALAESTRTTHLAAISSALSSSRVRFKQLSELETGIRADASLQANIAEFRSAWHELKLTATIVAALALRGRLYTQTMLAALGATSTYSENGFAHPAGQTVTFGEA